VEYKKNLPILLSDAEKRRKERFLRETDAGFTKNRQKKWRICSFVFPRLCGVKKYGTMGLTLRKAVM